MLTYGTVNDADERETTIMDLRSVSTTPNTIRLVQRPNAVASATFVGWGPRLGSI